LRKEAGGQPQNEKGPERSGPEPELGSTLLAGGGYFFFGAAFFFFAGFAFLVAFFID
jgi:hypothetical protein